jgi:formamidopyrimidine-DNA glycosylase
MRESGSFVKTVGEPLRGGIMPELPEIVNLARQMTRTLEGKRISRIELAQPKCLNMRPDRFRRRILRKTVGATRAHGKWLFTRLEPRENLLLNLGMGGDLRYLKNSDTLPAKRQLRLTFNDGTELTASFWWFGYIHLSSDDELLKHKMTRKLGMAPLDPAFTAEKLGSMLSGRRGAIKSFLLDQRNIAGIGNVYVQDILFRARLNPLREIHTLRKGDIEALHRSMRDVLNESIKLGGLKYETDLRGRRGRYGPEHYRVAYKAGKPCPVCRTRIRKIRTGSTASYICPKCQKLR